MLAVIEVDRVVGEFLSGLMAFSRDEDDVTRERVRDGEVDSLCPVGKTAKCFSFQTIFNLANNF